MRQYLKLSELQKRRRETLNIPTYGEPWKCPECGNITLDSYYKTQKDNGLFRVRECKKCNIKCETFEKILKWRKIK